MSYQGKSHASNDFLKKGFCSCGQTSGIKYIKNIYCANYQLYGYNCLGVRISLKGNLLSSPFGAMNTKYPTGPNFEGQYMEKYYNEFKGVF
jgi:hypothetical protein